MSRLYVNPFKTFRVSPSIHKMSALAYRITGPFSKYYETDNPLAKRVCFHSVTGPESTEINKIGALKPRTHATRRYKEYRFYRFVLGTVAANFPRSELRCSPGTTNLTSDLSFNDSPLRVVPKNAA